MGKKSWGRSCRKALTEIVCSRTKRKRVAKQKTYNSGGKSMLRTEKCGVKTSLISCRLGVDP